MIRKYTFCITIILLSIVSSKLSLSQSIYIQHLNGKQVNEDYLLKYPDSILGIEFQSLQVTDYYASMYQNLDNLKYMYFSDCKITMNDINFEKLKGLKDLEIKYSNLSNLNHISKCLTLKRLYIEGTKITSLPKSMNHLVNLKILVLSNNEKLNTIDNQLTLNILQHFTILNSPQIKELPASLFMGSNLVSLNVLNIELCKLPKSLTNCHLLEKIDISISDNFNIKTLVRLNKINSIKGIRIGNSKYLSNRQKLIF